MNQNQNIPEDLTDPIQEIENEEIDFNPSEADLDTDTEDTNSKPGESTDKDLQELKDKYLRLLAEFENYKRRTNKERIEFAKYASQELIISLLSVLDDFEREAKYGLATEGSILIHNKLLQVLKLKGLSEMDSKGQSFDPSLHEAVTELTVPEDQKNKIIDTVEKGYYLNDKIIRYAKVVVGK